MNRYMYVNCEVGEDCEGEPSIWYIHNVSDEPMFQCFDGHIEDTRTLMFDTAPPIRVSFKRPCIKQKGNDLIKNNERNKHNSRRR